MQKLREKNPSSKYNFKARIYVITRGRLIRNKNRSWSSGDETKATFSISILKKIEVFLSKVAYKRTPSLPSNGTGFERIQISISIQILESGGKEWPFYHL